MFICLLQCWEFEPKNRPTFQDLVNSLSHSLEAMAGYLDVGALGRINTPIASIDPVDLDDLAKEPSQSQSQVVGTICDETSM